MTFTVWHIVGACIIVAIVVAVIATLRTRHKDIKKVAYMMDALEDGELNFRFQDKNKFNRTLNRIRTIFEKQRQAHEQDSWTKLIRVLTHEIMNTVSPIASLSDVMAKSVDENGQSELDIKAGLDLGLLEEPDRIRADIPPALRRGETHPQGSGPAGADG